MNLNKRAILRVCLCWGTFFLFIGWLGLFSYLAATHDNGAWLAFGLGFPLFISFSILMYHSFDSDTSKE